MGKFDFAEKYFIRLLKELEPNDPLNGIIYEDLGELAALRGEYDMSIQWHQKSLRLKNGKQINDTNNMDTLKSSISKYIDR
jgi:tetratricopeptide (TPR) repeat protein